MGLQDGKTVTDLHVNPTDRNQYFHFSSTHAKHTKSRVSFRQTSHISRLFSNKSEFEWSKEKMGSWFVKKEYFKNPIDSEMRKNEFNINESNQKNKS